MGFRPRWGRYERLFLCSRRIAPALCLMTAGLAPDWAPASAPSHSRELPAAGGVNDIERLEQDHAYDGQSILDIRITGNKDTRDTTILRELFLQPGDLYDSVLLARDLEFLRGLGIFAQVHVEALPLRNGVQLVYSVVERGELRYGLIYPVGDYHDDKFQLGLVYRHRSLFGGREGFMIEASTGRQDQVELRISRPWLAGKPIEHRLDFDFVSREEDNPFQLHRVGAGIWMSRDIRRPRENRFLLYAALGRRELDPEDGDRTEWINSMSLGYSRDTRSSFMQPTHGGYFALTATIYDPKLGSSVALIQSNLSLRRYLRLGGGWVTSLTFDSNNQSGTLFYKGVYSLGGMDNVRGYPARAIQGWEEIEDESETEIVSYGRNRVLLHVELRHNILPLFTLDLPILGIVDVQGEGVLFADAGFLWSRDQPLVPRDIEKRAHGGGVGLRLYTPIGDVLRAEFGLGEGGRYRVHLGSGLGF